MSTGDDFATGRWEIGIYRLTQCLGLLMGIPNKKLSGILNKRIWEICELYAQLLAQFLPKSKHRAFQLVADAKIR